MCCIFVQHLSIFAAKTKTMSIFSGYRPLHFSAKPMECPQCGSNIIAEIVYEDHNDPLQFDKGKEFLYVGKMSSVVNE